MRSVLLTAASLLATSVLGLALFAGNAHAEEVRSVFFVSKSSNRNQVHYGVRLDSQCAPAGRAPVFAWWKMREEGPGVTQRLSSREQPIYGLGPQRVARRADGGTVTFELRSLEGRTIHLESRREGERCEVRAVSEIGGARALLHRAHAVTAFLGVRYVDIHGVRLADGRRIIERYDP